MANHIKNKKFVFFLAIIVILFTGSATLALQVDWPDSPMGTSLNEGIDGKPAKLPQLIQYLYEWGIALGGLAAFIALLTAGIQYLSSVGNPAQMGEAQGRIKSAAMGLVLLLGSWLILYTINPDLTTFEDLSLPTPETFQGCDNPDEACVCEGNEGDHCEIEGEKYEVGEEYPCKGDAYCQYNFGCNYECENNTCTMEMADMFKVNDCEFITVRYGSDFVRLKTGETAGSWNDGTPYGLKIPAGSSFGIEADPYQCMGTLILGETALPWGCSGDTRTLAVQPGAVNYTDPVDMGKCFTGLTEEEEQMNFTLDINVKCITFKKLGQ
jgi:hypothetical protein